MKIFLFLILTVSIQNAFADDIEFTVKSSDISKYVCENTMNVYIVENCIKDVNSCIQGVMSQRMLLPGGESQRFIEALKECSMSI